MKIQSLVVACLGVVCLNLEQAGAVPVLTLTEVDDHNLDWSWSDSTLGSGTFFTPTEDLWNAFSIPLPQGVDESFYGRWEEGYVFLTTLRNDVYLKSVGPGQGELFVSSDYPDFSGNLALLGTSLSSDFGSYLVVFNDHGDHLVTNVTDSGVGSCALAGMLGGLAMLRRRNRI